MGVPLIAVLEESMYSDLAGGLSAMAVRPDARIAHEEIDFRTRRLIACIIYLQRRARPNASPQNARDARNAAGRLFRRRRGRGDGVAGDAGELEAHLHFRRDLDEARLADDFQLPLR